MTHRVKRPAAKEKQLYALKATHFHAWSTQLKTIILIATCVACLSYFIILSNCMYFLCVNHTVSIRQCCWRTSRFHLVYIQLFYLCFLLLAFVSGHHHSHHPVSVGGSSFPMSTMFTHNHTCSNTTHLWDDTVTIKAHFYVFVCVCNTAVQYKQVGQFINFVAQHR